jgi:hypothetical protein
MERALAAQEILRQMGVRGEIDWIGYDAKRGVMTLPVSRPGRSGTVRLFLAEGQAAVAWSPWRLSSAVNWLHKMPGPHLARTRGNWSATRLWRGVADGVVYGVLFVTATGVYLWMVVRAERRAGLAFLGAGAASFIGLVYALL